MKANKESCELACCMSSLLSPASTMGRSDSLFSKLEYTRLFLSTPLPISEEIDVKSNLDRCHIMVDCSEGIVTTTEEICLVIREAVVPACPSIAGSVNCAAASAESL